MVATILVRRMPQVSAQPVAGRSVPGAPCLDVPSAHARPIATDAPRGRPRAHRPLRRRLRAGTVVAVAEQGRRLRVRGEPGRRSSSCSAPRPPGSSPAGAAHGPRLELLGPDGQPELTGACTSGKCSAQCSRSTLADPGALARRPPGSARSSSRWPSIGTPAIVQLHRQPLEQQLDRPLPGVLAGSQLGRSAGRRPPAHSAYSRLLAAVSAPRSISTLPSASVYSLLRRLQPLRPAAALAHAAQTAPAAFSSCPAHVAGDRLGVPGPRRRGLHLGELAHARAGLLGVVVVGLDRHVRRAVASPHVERVEAVADERQPVVPPATARSARARGPGRSITLKPATSSPSSTVPAICHRARRPRRSGAALCGPGRSTGGSPARSAGQ